MEIRLNLEELVLLKRSLGEMCHGMSLTDRDFQVILGANRHEAEALLRRINAVVERLKIVPRVD